MTFYCDYEISPARMYVDPEPAENCDAEVENEGDMCPRHEEPDEPDYEREP